MLLRESSSPALAPSTEIRCNRSTAGAADCTVGKHARAARGIWPSKTAECWADAAGVKPRMAKYWLAGEAVSDSGRLALVRELA